MKTKITYISIIVLLIGVIVYLLTQGNTQEERVEIKTTIEKIPVKVETPAYVPKGRTKIETITEFQFETDTFQVPVDTNEILKDYYICLSRHNTSRHIWECSNKRYYNKKLYHSPQSPS